MNSSKDNIINEISKIILKKLLTVNCDYVNEYYSFNIFVWNILISEIKKIQSINNHNENIIEKLAKNITKYVDIPNDDLSISDKKIIYTKNKQILRLAGYILLLHIYLNNFIYLNLQQNIINNPGYFIKLKFNKLDFIFSKLVKKLIKDKYYDERCFTSYLNSKKNQDIMDKIFQNSHKYYADYEYASILLFKLRYLVTVRNYLILDNPFSVFLSISIANLNNNIENYVVSMFELLARRLISLSTPILLNLRSNGNLSSCFIMKTNDSIEEIYDSISKIAKITKNAGGVGINVSRIRAYGSSIGKKNHPAVGVIPFIRVMNDTILCVNQSGARNGALTVALDVWHKDLLTFLDIDTEKGDIRLKSFDIFTQIVINDVFIDRVIKKSNWTLFDPHEVWTKYKVRLDDLTNTKFKNFYLKIEKDKNLSKVILPAIQIVKIILKRWIEKGTPYITMKDRINDLNPNKHCGIIYNGNLCQESFSNFSSTELSTNQFGENKISKLGDSHTCNLLSINLASFADQYGTLTLENLEVLKNIIKMSVLFLDNTIEKSNTPIPESFNHNQKYRTIGIGVIGLADFLAYNEIKYSESTKIIKYLFSTIGYFAIFYSSKLSKIRGRYKYFTNSEWDKGIFFGKNIKELLKDSPHLNWNKLFDNIKKYGLRNGQLLSIAPNTSSSIIQGCSASVLPLFSPNFVDKNAKGIFHMFGKFFDTKLEYYEYNMYLDQIKVIDVLSEIQNYVDQGISSELCLNMNYLKTARSILNIFIHGIKKLKTIYYVRIMQIDANKRLEKKHIVSCWSCAN